MGQKVWITVAFTVAALSAFAADDTYVIKRSPKVGETNKMLMKAELTISGAAAVLTGTAVEKTTKVESDGTYTVEQTLLNGMVKFKDQEIPAPPAAAAITIFKLNGEIVEYKNEQGVSDVRSANLSVFRQPDKPLKLTDSWVYDYKGDPKIKTKTLRGIYTIQAEEMVGKFKCLKIKQVVSETEGNDPASVEGTLWLDLTDWTIVKSVSKWTNVPTGDGSIVSGTVTLTRSE